MGQNLDEGKKKKCSVVNFLSISSSSCWHDYILSSSTTWRSLSQHIPMSFLSIVIDNTFVNRSTKLSLDLIRRIAISSLFGVNESKRLGRYMLNSITLNVSFFNLCNVCNIINLVALPLKEGSPYVSIIYLIDFQNIVVPPYIITYLIWDRALWGSKR